RRALPLEDPFVDALVVAHDLGHLIGPFGRDMVLVHVPGLDRVVVDADQDHVFHAHGDGSFRPGDAAAGVTPRVGRVEGRVDSGVDVRTRRPRATPPRPPPAR